MRQGMRHAAGFMLGLSLLMCGCSSRDEVLRVTSPDGRVDAIAFESDCGAPCDFVYEIRLVPRGSSGGEEVASLDGALRSEHSWGVNLKWLGADKLSVEYLRADNAMLLKQVVDVSGRAVKVSLRGGVNDPQAPAGGMVYSLHQRLRD